MTLTTTIALPVALFFVALGLFIYVVRWRANTGAVAKPRRADVVASIRMADIARLRRLRRQLEDGGAYDSQAVALLYDVCQTLGLDDGQAQHVLGPALELVIDAPVWLDDLENLL